MARFIGSIEDYEKYIGPRIRNVVNLIAKNERDKKQGICEFCGKESELQAAHKQGKERKTLIRQALEKYNNGSYLDIDIEKCENEIIELHKPIDQVFYFLCSDCHRKYDNENKQKTIDTAIIIDTPVKKNEPSSETRINNIDNNLKRKNNESVQAFVKRILNTFFANGSLSSNEISRLKTKEYSQKTFGIDFPLLVENADETIISGHSRYWTSMKFGGKYYACSQWWKDKFPIYEPLIEQWINYIINKSGN